MPPAFDFPGGIYPPERKTLSTARPLTVAPLPRRVVLPLKQHSGRPALPCVKTGEHVQRGTLLARPDGMISAALHASISGHVSEISDTHIVIDGDGLNTTAYLPPLNWRETNTATLLARLDTSGVVGLGGAGFPTQVKARVRERHAIDTLIINAAECEPYITADDMMLRHFAADVLEGAQLIAGLCGAKRILLGIEDNKPEAMTALSSALKDSQPLPVEMASITTRYPSGGERQLIKKLLNLEVPSAGLPADVGVVCHNPGTLLACVKAVRDGEPLVSRIVTLTGQALARPGNYQVAIGASIAETLEQAGLEPSRLGQLVSGGPMMGTSVDDLSLPISKTTNCLIAATPEEFPAPPAEMPCIRCGACETVCPASLLPQQLHWYARQADDARLERYHLFDCIECGACSYVCPSHIPLVDDYRGAKQRIRLQQIDTAKAEHARHRFEFRQARLAREEAEKQARREARKARSKNTVTQEETKTTSTSSGVSQSEIRRLRIAQTAARAAVRKAEKALARAAEQSPEVSQEDLEIQLATARENLKTTEARLASAREQAS